MKSLILGIKRVFKHQDLQVFCPKLNKLKRTLILRFTLFFLIWESLICAHNCNSFLQLILTCYETNSFSRGLITDLIVIHSADKLYIFYTVKSKAEVTMGKKCNYNVV